MGILDRDFAATRIDIDRIAALTRAYLLGIIGSNTVPFS